MAEVIWEREGLQVLRRECEEPDSFRYEYTLKKGEFIGMWTQNPQEYGIYGRAQLDTKEAMADLTMFLKNERYFNHYGVKL